MIICTSAKYYLSLLDVFLRNSDEHSAVNKQQPDICKQMLAIKGCISCTHKILIITHCLFFFFYIHGNGFGFVPIKPFRVHISPHFVHRRFYQVHGTFAPSCLQFSSRQCTILKKRMSGFDIFLKNLSNIRRWWHNDSSIISKGNLSSLDKCSACCKYVLLVHITYFVHFF